jgi:thiol-disulfide isomerase/thioredoxin
MALTPTKQIPLGFQAPEFHLQDIPTGNMMTFAAVKGEKGTLVMFICNHCPYVKHVMHELIQLGRDFIEKGVGFVAINSNDVEKLSRRFSREDEDLCKGAGFPFSLSF